MNEELIINNLNTIYRNAVSAYKSHNITRFSYEAIVDSINGICNALNISYIFIKYYGDVYWKGYYMKKADRELLKEVYKDLFLRLGSKDSTVIKVAQIIEHIEEEEKKRNAKMVQYITERRKENPKYCH